MKLHSLITPVAAVATLLALGATPALADDHHGGRGGAVHRDYHGNAVARRPPVVVRPRVVAPYRVAPYRYYGYRPYVYHPYPYAYHFRPRFGLGFGISLGYPIPYAYYDPLAYPVGGPITVAPGTAYGGLTFQMSPSDATVTVDGTFAGIVGDFYDPGRPLSLPAGRHHVEINAPGFNGLIFDVDVPPGQVVPYQGDLQRY